MSGWDYTPPDGQPRGYRYFFREGTYWKYEDHWGLTDEECDKRAVTWIKTRPSGAVDVILRGRKPDLKIVWEKQDQPASRAA